MSAPTSSARALQAAFTGGVFRFLESAAELAPDRMNEARLHVNARKCDADRSPLEWEALLLGELGLDVPIAVGRVKAGPYTGEAAAESMARFRVQVVERKQLEGEEARWPVERRTPRACHCAEAAIRMPATPMQWRALLEDGLHDAELAAGGLYLDEGDPLFALAARALYEIASALETESGTRRDRALAVLSEAVPALEQPMREQMATLGHGYGWSVVQAPPVTGAP